MQTFLIVVISLLCASTLRSQEVQVAARVDSNNILIGDWLKLHLEAKHGENVTVQFPPVADSLQGLEIVKRDPPTKQQSNQQTLESATYTVTAFDTGTFIVPPLVFHYTVGGDTTRHTAETLPIAIFVHGLGVDTTKEIKDIKPPLSLGISFAELLPYILTFVGVALAGWLIYYIVKKRRRGEALIPSAPPRPPHEIALEDLRSLEAEKLWQRGMVKEYYSQLTDIIRTYIEKRYAILAMEMITDEILSSAEIASLEKPVREKLRDMLMLADLAKFAKFQPVAEEHERSIRSAFEFVEATHRSVPEPATPEPAQETTA